MSDNQKNKLAYVKLEEKNTSAKNDVKLKVLEAENANTIFNVLNLPEIGKKGKDK